MNKPNKAKIRNEVFKDFDKFVGTQIEITNEDLRLGFIVDDRFRAEMQTYNRWKKGQHDVAMKALRVERGTGYKEINDIVESLTSAICEGNSWDDNQFDDTFAEISCAFTTTFNLLAKTPLKELEKE